MGTDAMILVFWMLNKLGWPNYEAQKVKIRPNLRNHLVTLLFHYQSEKYPKRTVMLPGIDPTFIFFNISFFILFLTASGLSCSAHT